MKRTIKVALVAVFAAVAGYGVYTSQKSNVAMSDLILDNMEALAGDEIDECPNGCSGPGDGCYCYGWYDYHHEV